MRWRSSWRAASSAASFSATWRASTSADGSTPRGTARRGAFVPVRALRGAAGRRVPVVRFLVAIPRDSRKTIRLDAAYPLSQQLDGVGGVDIRLTITTAGRRYWREPAAFHRSRIVPMLRSLLGWF